MLLSKKKKGFMHIAELIIIILVASVIILQLSSFPLTKPDFSRARLNAMANDWLFIVDKNLTASNFHWDSNDGKNRAMQILNENLPGNIAYEIKMIDENGVSILAGDNVKNPSRAFIFSIDQNGRPIEIILSLGYRY